MKKYFRIFLLYVAVILLTLCFTACGYPSEEEVTPTVLGEQEGLWLYKGNTRSRTDGSEAEALLTEITLDGETYTADEFSIYKYCYVTPTHKIFFVLSIEEDAYFLYLYDYEYKSGEYLSALPYEEIKLCENDTVYVDSENTKLIYDLEGNLLHEFHMPEPEDNRFAYERLYEADYQNGVFYSVYRHSFVVWEDAENDIYGNWQVVWIDAENGIHVGNWEHDYYIEWWEDGETHIVELAEYPSHRYVKVTQSDIFFVYDDLITDVVKASEKVYEFNLGKVDYSSKYTSARRLVQEIHFDDAAYVFSVAYFYKNERDTDWKYYLHKIQNGECTQVGEFDSGNYNTEMNVYQGSLYFRFDLDGRGGKNSYTYYKYDLSSGELKKIKKKDYHAEKALPTVEKKQVGEYAFFVTSAAYGYSGFMGGCLGHCYYLNRDHNGETEIMQYSFERDYFYDDICEF